MPAVSVSPTTPSAQARLVSLDALRGFDMLWILGADAVPASLALLLGGAPLHFIAGQMEHEPWAGFHFYDLIFPMFVFIVGVAIPLSLDRIVAERGRGAAVARILRRTLLLYLLGLFYYGGFATPLAQIRLMGVLQRIALSYCGASLVYLRLRPRGIVTVCAVILIGYWLLVRFVPVPGFGAGDFAEGHNFTNWIDARFLPLRKWDGDHDPEGLLSTLPSIVSCLLGVLACLWLRKPSESAAVRGWCLGAAGILLLAAGYLWGIEFPVIKKIWTSSFVLVAGGWSALFLAAFYLVIDVWKYRAWAQPFVWVGANALAIYVASSVVDLWKISERFAGGSISAGLNAVRPGLGALLLSLVLLGICLGICRFLYMRKIFLRL